MARPHPATDDVIDLLNREAMLLDERRWEEWLALWTEDCVLWMPAWANEHETTDEPDSQLNLLYLTPRSRIEDRVFRIESGDSYATVPMDRTVHLVSNVMVTGESGVDVRARAHWIVHSYGLHGGITRGGRYEYLLRMTGGGLRIAKKKVILIDDKLVGAVDIYHI